MSIFTNPFSRQMETEVKSTITDLSEKTSTKIQKSKSTVKRFSKKALTEVETKLNEVNSNINNRTKKTAAVAKKLFNKTKTNFQKSLYEFKKATRTITHFFQAQMKNILKTIALVTAIASPALMIVAIILPSSLGPSVGAPMFLCSLLCLPISYGCYKLQNNLKD
jgi:ElaB/YqjD/DUF883 family membrane-anchored ribosome-binding protein